MLLCHHFFMGVLPAPIDWANNSIWQILATLSKVCVAIFVILSGYGLNESYKRWVESDFAFVKNHLFKLMKQFWFIFLIFVPLGFVCGASPIDVYGRGLKGICYALTDFLGMKSLLNTPTMNQTWWYMEACIVLYILFPLLKKLLAKIPVIVFAISVIPVIKFGLFNDGSIDGCREIYWIFPFAVGIFLSEKDFLNKISSSINKHYLLGCSLSITGVIVMTAVRSYFGIIADTVYAISIIVVSKAVFSRIKYINSFMGYLGRHSANIFMMHSFLYCYYVPIKQIFMVLHSGTANFVLLALACIAISDYIEVLKGRLANLCMKNEPINKEEKISSKEPVLNK